ncbi:MAG: type II toxin-antitoxin system RatA family toxin [Gammaproteobacteria bacterium]|nr:type II toxin-antitoxin system RatA family toxin [Gammaproteobacteria bacterium]MDH3448597.1 type II toxin-antitoxin system RatA family toxin [Gammaproteobacteria bacterium]
MPEITRSALLPYPARFMYDLVNDVEKYPEFLPWCGGSRIHQADDSSMEASILMQGAGLSQWLKTRNRMIPGESIEITLAEGPFKSLQGLWQFTSVAEQGCRIELTLSFEFERGLAAAIIKPVFTRIANTMVDSFCQRAQELYGR